MRYAAKASLILNRINNVIVWIVLGYAHSFSLRSEHERFVCRFAPSKMHFSIRSALSQANACYSTLRVNRYRKQLKTNVCDIIPPTELVCDQLFPAIVFSIILYFAKKHGGCVAVAIAPQCLGLIQLEKSWRVPAVTVCAKTLWSQRGETDR